MTWSLSKKFGQKWYRICEHQNGDQDILEADHKWSIEKGLGDDEKADFNHYCKRCNQWYSQLQIKYKYLFFEPEDIVPYGYKIQQLENGEQLDHLFTELMPIEGWVTFIEEQIYDCIMAIEYKKAGILEHQAKIKSSQSKSDLNCEQNIDFHREQIARLTQEVQKLKLEQEELINKLWDEEGIKW
jgi:hypothetical protein